MSAVFDLKSRLQEMGLSPKKAFGQNFLVSPMVIRKIVDAVRAKPFSDLIEIGPGLGALTEPLLAADLHPRLIELDRDLIEHWRTRGCEVIDNDALKVDWQALSLRPGSLLVSNLPYQISTHLVIDRCFGPVQIERMVLMFQKEVAERLTAKPKTKAYGLLSVMAQTFFVLEKVTDAGPRDFFPPPKVASRVLSFTRKTGSLPGERFLTLLKAGFAFRRKFLLKNLKGVVDKSTMEKLPEIWKSLGLKDQARAEELTPEKWRELYVSLYERN
jgi:16S rRNA (adenine1518-N6/adenine1519-N6)-dimethyltransferase